MKPTFVIEKVVLETDEGQKPISLSNIDFELRKKLLVNQIDEASSILNSEANLLLSVITNIIESNMRHTTKHGWNYQYTGSLKNSFHKSKETFTYFKDDHLVFEQEIFSTHPASAILEFGGTITPRTKPFLAVPAKRTPFPINQLPMKTIDFWRNGIGYIVAGKSIIPAIVLKSSVRIPAYSYLSKAISLWAGE